MNKFETVIIIKPEISKEEFDKTIEEFKDLIISFSNEKKAKIKTEDIGVKKLAYEIQKHKEGHYFIIEFYSNDENINEFRRVVRYNDNVLKFIVVRKDEE